MPLSLVLHSPATDIADACGKKTALSDPLKAYWLVDYTCNQRRTRAGRIPNVLEPDSK